MFDLDQYTITSAAQRRMDAHGITLTEILRTVSRERPANVVDDSDVAWVLAMREETRRRRAGSERIRKAAQTDASRTPLLDAPVDHNPDIPRAF